MYIRDGQPFDIRQRQVVGDTQYPADWFEDPDARDANGIEPLHPTEAPAITSSQRLELLGYIRDEENRWVSHWIVVDLTADELAQIAADKAAAAAARVPKFVTMRQASQALIYAGLDDDVEGMLAAMPGQAGKLARAEWVKSQVVERDRPLVLQMGAALGLDSAALDALFIHAASL